MSGNNSEKLHNVLEELGFDFYTGVPCSMLSGIIELLTDKNKYLPATREDEAIGIAVGAYLAHKKPVVLMQNSGFCNSIGHIKSLVNLYNIPVLFIISMRGYEGDACEHDGMIEITERLLSDLNLPSVEIKEVNPTQSNIDSIKLFIKEMVNDGSCSAAIRVMK